MKLELRKLLQMLGVLQPDPVFYIGGSDVLPQPLAPAQEQALLRARERQQVPEQLQQAQVRERRKCPPLRIHCKLYRSQ